METSLALHPLPIGLPIRLTKQVSEVVVTDDEERYY